MYDAQKEAEIKEEQVKSDETQEKAKEEKKTEAKEERQEERGSSKLSVWKQKVKEFIRECIRVLRVTKKPDRSEFTTIVKVSGLGILIIGLIGFLVFLIKEIIV